MRRRTTTKKNESLSFSTHGFFSLIFPINFFCSCCYSPLFLGFHFSFQHLAALPLGTRIKTASIWLWMSVCVCDYFILISILWMYSMLMSLLSLRDINSSTCTWCAAGICCGVSKRNQVYNVLLFVIWPFWCIKRSGYIELFSVFFSTHFFSFLSSHLHRSLSVVSLFNYSTFSLKWLQTIQITCTFSPIDYCDIWWWKVHHSSSNNFWNQK